MNSWTLWLASSLALVGLGCSSPSGSEDGGSEDSSTEDSGAQDAGNDAATGDADTSTADTGVDGGTAVYRSIFSTGFEGTSEVVVIDSEFGDITGSEPERANSDFELIENSAPIGELRLYFEDGTPADRYAIIEEFPVSTANRALLTQVDLPAIVDEANHASEATDVACNDDPPGSRKGRIQVVMRNNVALREFEYTVRLYLGAGFRALASSPRQNHWMTIGEYWNNLARQPNPFRISLGLHNHADRPGELSWVLKADERRVDTGGTLRWFHVWDGEEQVADEAVPLEEWVTIRVRVVEGDRDSGRVTLWRIDDTGTEHVLIDVHDITHDPDDAEPDGFADINPIKLYTSGEVICGVQAGASVPLQIWWDDFELRGSVAG